MCSPFTLFMVGHHFDTRLSAFWADSGESSFISKMSDSLSTLAGGFFFLPYHRHGFQTPEVLRL
jgi:hypothetical protein